MNFLAEINKLSQEYNIGDFRDVFKNAIGSDYQSIRLQLWPQYARRNGYPVADTQGIPEFFKTLFLTFRAKYRPGRRRWF